MSVNLVNRTDQDGITHLELNAPKSINALSDEMLAALTQAFADIADDRSIRAVILSGAGNHFCAGHNLKEMTAHREDADGGLVYFQDWFLKPF